jgi:hypothetical protein
MDVDASALGPTLASLDLLARLRLRGARFRGVSPELRDLARFCGLARALGLEVERQSEEREEACRVEEEGHIDDASLP